MIFIMDTKCRMQYLSASIYREKEPRNFLQQCGRQQFECLHCYCGFEAAASSLQIAALGNVWYEGVYGLEQVNATKCIREGVYLRRKWCKNHQTMNAWWHP